MKVIYQMVQNNVEWFKLMSNGLNTRKCRIFQKHVEWFKVVYRLVQNNVEWSKIMLKTIGQNK